MRLFFTTFSLQFASLSLLCCVMPPSRTSNSRKPSSNPHSPAQTPKRRSQKKANDSTADPADPSAAALLNQTLMTTDEWYKSKHTKTGYANYVKAGKAWLLEWLSENGVNSSASSSENPSADVDTTKLKEAFDSITEYTPIVL